MEKPTEKKERTSSARATADLEHGRIEATVEVAPALDRVFGALASDEVVRWWVRPGVFDTREWSGEVRPGGAWKASGVGQGRPYGLEGEFLEVDPPYRLVHTWRPAGAPRTADTTVSYRLEQVSGQTRVTLEHSGFTSPETCANTSAGWETSFERLQQLLDEQQPASSV